MYRATVLIANTRVDTLGQLAKIYKPALAIVADESLHWKLKNELEPLGIATAAGADAVAEAMGRDDVDMVVNATVGYSGLRPTLAAIAAGKEIALANKETLVVAGDLVKKRLAESSSKLYPIDSEHSAIWQCLRGEDPESVSRLIITASGGPFRLTPKDQMQHVTTADALKHPSWNMGAKITIDSATMLNKAFEIIEAHWLFDIEADRIVPIVHPQSIVHSMVEFKDGAIKAQMGVPDMRLPIAYALGKETRLPGAERQLKFSEMSNLTFEEPDFDRFPCLSLAYEALRKGGNTACVINAANEVAVAAFLRSEIRYTDIYRYITECLEKTAFVAHPGYEDYVATDEYARQLTKELIEKSSH